MKLVHSKYLILRTRDRLCDLFHNRTSFGAGLVRPGKTLEEWCKTCYRENDGEIIREKILHAMYECPSVIHVREEIFLEFEFDLIRPHIPQNSGSLVLATELSNPRQSPDTSNLTELVNLIWALTNNDILIANKSNKTPRADIIISNIKGILKHIARTKPESPVAISLKDRDLIKLLNSGYSPHT